ncbi:MAG TPA: glycosyltransferase [Burkholderiaceae bacterium]|nr:glycosyltransferase [Burkholderiaceae bacterium]
MRLAIIICCRNASASIEAAVARLQPLRRRGARVIVVDGGSTDDTVRRAAATADIVIGAPRSRALQMNAGARSAPAQEADVLLFLEPEAILPPDADRAIFRGLSNSACRWGRFDLGLAGRSAALPRFARWLNGITRLTGLCSRAQALFVERGTFLALDGFGACGPLEVFDFCRRAGAICPPLVIASRVVVPGAALERAGLWRVALQTSWLRLGFLAGAPPDSLARRYPDAI